MKTILEAKNVTKVFQTANNKVVALDDVSFKVYSGELVVILGPSGAGKSTLLNVIGGMDKVSSGNLIVNGEDISKYNKSDLTLYRRNEIGFVFQFYNLMPNLTALENIELATELKDDSLEPASVLESVGLKDRMNNFPSQLSGGEQQRVSIARALAKNPNIVLCDEPTGALDYVTGKSILALLAKASRKMKKTVIIVTHNQALKDFGDKVFFIKNGRIEKEVYNEHPKDISAIEW